MERSDLFLGAGDGMDLDNLVMWRAGGREREWVLVDSQEMPNLLL